VNAERRALPQYQDNGSKTVLPMKLAPNESAFVVFEKSQLATDATENYPEAKAMLTVDSPWTVTFQPERRGPKNPQTFASLTDWAQSQDESIRYYSGIANYTNSFTLESVPEKPLYLDLGRVMVMAKVYVNDQYAGGAWTYPYQVNVTDYLKAGNNIIRVEVVNNWMNRLIGDQKLPESERKTWTSVNPWNANSTLQPSGLMGPVRLVSF